MRSHPVLLSTAVAAMTLAPLPTTAQTGSDTWSVPRTPDGQPDLQGVWDFRTITPLERPAELAEKAVLSEEEAAEFQQRWASEENRDRRDGLGTTEVASDGRSDVARAYNEFWWDRGTEVVSDCRTSLIVAPPDGRIPALTPEGQRKAEARAAERSRWSAVDIDRRGPSDGPEDRGVSERCILGFNSSADAPKRLQRQRSRGAGTGLRCAACRAPGFLDSGLKVITSTLPRPARRNRGALGLDSDSRTSPASTARCTSVETRARRGGVPRSFRSSAPTRDSPLTCG